MESENRRENVKNSSSFHPPSSEGKVEDKDISLARHRFDVRVKAECSDDKTLHFILHQRIFVLLLLESRANMR